MTEDNLNQLIDAWLTGQLSEADAALLSNHLREDEAARERLIQVADVHASLSVDESLWTSQAEAIPAARKAKAIDWISSRPLAAAAAGIVFGMFSASMLFAYVMPGAMATVSRLSALMDGSFEQQRGPLPSGFPTEFGPWSGDETELVEGGLVQTLEGKRILRFVRSSERPAMGNSCDIYQLIDLRSLGVSKQDGESALELSARFLDGRATGGDPLRFILRLYVFSGSPDSLREKWPLTWKNAMTLPEALSSGNTLLQSGGTKPDTWREVKAKALLPPNAEFALVHVGVYSPKAPSGASVEFGNQFVDDVRLTLQTQPVLPVRMMQR